MFTQNVYTYFFSFLYEFFPRLKIWDILLVLPFKETTCARKKFRNHWWSTIFSTIILNEAVSELRKAVKSYVYMSHVLLQIFVCKQYTGCTTHSNILEIIFTAVLLPASESYLHIQCHGAPQVARDPIHFISKWAHGDRGLWPFFSFIFVFVY